MRKIFFLVFGFSSGSVYCLQKGSEEIFDSCFESTFRLKFIDKDTSQLKASMSGFFITDDGLGVTSGLLSKPFQNCKLVLELSDSSEIPAYLSFNNSTPQIAFVQVNLKSKKLKISDKPLEEGQSLWVMGMRESKAYFTDVMITDTQHNWIKVEGNDLVSFKDLRTTGVLPHECLGGPLVDEEGNSVGVIFNIEMGLGIGFAMVKLKQVNPQGENWKIIKAWNKVKESLIRNFT